MKSKLKNSRLSFDPAPSKVAYFIHRVWLRKSFRFSLLIIIPIVLVFCTFVLFGNKIDLNVAIEKSVKKVVDVIAISPTFNVTNISVISDDLSVIEKIKAILSLDFPLSSLSIDVKRLKTQVESIDAVQSASVRVTSIGLIEIAVKIRKPVAIHRVGNSFLLIDASGIEVDQVAARSQRLDLPLLVGEGAEHFVSEALTLLLETKGLITRVRGLVRIGERRWDVILDRKQVINLPEEDPLKAIKKIVSLHEGRRLLDRDILYLDFRNINRPVLGLTNDVSNALRDIRNLVRGENV